MCVGRSWTKFKMGDEWKLIMRSEFIREICESIRRHPQLIIRLIDLKMKRDGGGDIFYSKWKGIPL